jgi:hypothetical protein
VEDKPRDGFAHCPFWGRDENRQPIPNPLSGWDNLYDPVDAAEQIYSAAPCDFAECEENGVTGWDDPDGDEIPARRECGSAAASALRYEVEVDDGLLSVALRGPDPAAGEPPSPEPWPSIAGISVRRLRGFIRGDANADADPPDKIVDLSDPIFILNYLFQGGPEPPCREAADADADGELNLTDGVYLLNYLFKAGPAPPHPFPGCGTPGPGADCRSYPPCEG